MFFYDSTIILLIPAMIFAVYASAKVNSTFRRYASVEDSRRLTGAQAARQVLDANGLSDVKIVPVAGNLTDNYNPKDKTLNLSESVYNQASIGAVSVACHEVGHAIQDSKHYAPLVIRNGIVPVVNFAANMTWPLIFIGLILLGIGNIRLNYFGDILFNIGIIAFIAVVAFHAITLPVEFNASRRALQQMESLNIVDSDEIVGARKVLTAAALTYVAALAVAVANLLRLLAIRGRNS